MARHTGGSLQGFFDGLNAGEAALLPVWEEYLDWLAQLCSNLITAFDAPLILGGYLGAYLEPWLPQLRRRVAARATFPGTEDALRACRYPNEAAAVGAALLWIRPFLEDAGGA